MGRWASAALLGGALVRLAEGAPRCLDGAGRATDYWYSFKYADGWDYAYMERGLKLAKAPATMNSSTSPVSRTLEQLYTGHRDLSYAMWSDEHPDGTQVAGPWAHAKGVVAFDGESGFWLTHSLPAWPGDVKTGMPAYDGTSDKYGQSYLCITIDEAAFKTISKLAMVNKYSVYDAADHARLGRGFAAWALEQQHGIEEARVATLVATVTSAGGQDFTAFAKSASWGDELYGSLVAPHFGTDLYTATGQSGAGRLGSSCEGQSHDSVVENVLSVQYPGSSFRETSDHSKWAVSSVTDSHAFCVGDLDRQEGHYSRGGGTICIDAKEFAQQMFEVVATYEPCDNDAVVV